MKERYERQILLGEIGKSGQKKLEMARVLVVGAGGLGTPVLTYLSCAGVGFVRVVEKDTISISNLNRQFFYSPEDVGKKKGRVALDHLNKLNPLIEIEMHDVLLEEKNVEAMLEDIDIVVDCVDNVATRMLLNKYCLKKNIPLVEAGIEGFYGFVMVITKESACLQCMGLDQIKETQRKPIPVIGTTAGVIGSIQANECIKMILGLSTDDKGKLIEYDGLQGTLTRVQIKKSPLCRLHE